MRTAMLSPFGSGVILDKRGAEIAAAGIEAMIMGARTVRGQGAKIPAQVLEVLEVCRIAATEPATGSDQAAGPPAVAPSAVQGMRRADDLDSPLGGGAAIRGGRRLSTGEAAEIIGISDSAVRLAARLGRLPAERIGRAWVILDRDARAYVPRDGKDHL